MAFGKMARRVKADQRRRLGQLMPKRSSRRRKRRRKGRLAQPMQ
jgi:hypothetical protein